MNCGDPKTKYKKIEIYMYDRKNKKNITPKLYNSCRFLYPRFGIYVYTHIIIQ